MVRIHSKEEWSKDALSQIYDNAQKRMQEFRTLMAKILFGFLGVFAVLTGLVIKNASSFDIDERAYLTLALVFIIGFSLHLSRQLENYFQNIAKVVHRIDCIYGVFEEGRYVEGQSLFPIEWNDFGTENWKEPIFRSAYTAMIGVGIFGISIIWLV